MTIVDIWHRTADGWRSRAGGLRTVTGLSPTATWLDTRGAAPIGTTSYPVPAGAIHVAKTGSDSNSGTEVSPYLTVRQGLTSAGSGDTVVVHEGSYHEGGPQYTTPGGFTSGLGQQLSVPTDEITLQAAPGEAVWFDGSEVVTGWASETQAGGTVWRAPFARTVDRAPTEVKGETASVLFGNFIVPEFPIAHWPEAVWVDGVQLEPVSSIAAVVPGKFFVVGSALGTGTHLNTFTSTHYVIGDNPAGKEVRISSLARVLSFSRSGFTMRGVGIRRYNSALCDWGTVYGSGENCTLEHVVVEDISTRGIQSDGDGMHLNHCTFQRCGQVGIGNGSDAHLVEHALFRENNSRRFNYGPDAGGMKVGRSQQGTIRYCHFDTNYGHACWFDQVVYQTLTHGNLFTDNHGNGLMVEISDGNLVVDNIFVNNGNPSTDVASRPPYSSQALRVSGSDNVVVWGNTFINCEVPIRLNQDPRDPLTEGSFGEDPRFDKAWYDANCTWDMDNTVLANNAVLGSPGLNQQQAVLFSLGQAFGKTVLGLGTVFSDGNLYVRTAADEPTRFGISYYPTGTDVKVHSSMTSSGTGTFDPVISWTAMLGEAGSVLVTDTDPADSGGQIKASLLAQVTPATVPANVQALLDVSPFTAQSVGAGYLP